MEDKNLFTTVEVARFLSVDSSTVRRWIKLGVLDAIELPRAGSRRAYRVHRTTLTRYADLPSEHPLRVQPTQ